MSKTEGLIHYQAKLYDRKHFHDVLKEFTILKQSIM